ncbi:MAG: DUF3987 domain-containing protein [Planctomycetes bacterium]|nr:DUF3987 domain-containing protein [Planctomycetota bacterium]
MSRQLNDWLETYMLFTQNTEPPTLYHLWSGVVALSSALRRKCFCNWGSRGYIYPNLYVSLVGPPGGRKGTAMKIAKQMVQTLDIPMGSDSLGSTQALYKEIMESEADYMQATGLAKKYKSLSIWSEEFQVFLSDRDLTLVGALTDLFDCADTWKYTTLKRKTEDISNCWLTIIGAITPSLLQSKLSQDAVGGGLLSRIIFVVGYGPIRRIALPFLTEEEEILKRKLNEDLQQIANLSGPFKLCTSFLRAYARWYENANAAEGVSDDKFLGYNSRRALHLNKICMIVSASESSNMELHDHHFNKSLAILEATEKEMPNAFHGLGMATQANVYAKILSYIETHDTFSWNEILRHVSLDINNTQELRNLMEMAEQSGLVDEKQTTSSLTYAATQKQTKAKGSRYLAQTLYSQMTNL